MTKILLINNRRDFEVISKREDTRDRRDLNSFIDFVCGFFYCFTVGGGHKG